MNFNHDNDCNECNYLRKQNNQLRKELQKKDDVIEYYVEKYREALEDSKKVYKALEKSVQGYRNLIEYKVLPGVGWEQETEKYIKEAMDIIQK